MARWMYRRVSGSVRFVIQLGLVAGMIGSAKAEIIGIDLGPGKSPANWNTVSESGVVANLRDESGEVSGVRLTVANPGTPYSVVPVASSIPKHKNDLSGIDGNGYQFNGTFNATLNGLEPGRLYSIYLFGLRGGAELNQSVTLDGGQIDVFGFAPPNEGKISGIAVNRGVGRMFYADLRKCCWPNTVLRYSSTWRERRGAVNPAISPGATTGMEKPSPI